VAAPAFTYKKKIAPPRICPRQSAEKRQTACSKRQNFPVRALGFLSSLVDTDGLVELGEDITQVSARPDRWILVICKA